MPANRKMLLQNLLGEMHARRKGIMNQFSQRSTFLDGGGSGWNIKWMHRRLPLYPALVIGDIFSVEQLIRWGVFAQTVL